MNEGGYVSGIVRVTTNHLHAGALYELYETFCLQY